VDGADLMLWQTDTTIGNLSDWQTNFSVSTVAAVSAVPESASIMLLGLGGLMLLGTRGKRISVATTDNQETCR